MKRFRTGIRIKILNSTFITKEYVSASCLYYLFFELAISDESYVGSVFESTYIFRSVF